MNDKEYGLIKDIIAGIKESIATLPVDKDPVTFAQRLAYVECLEIIKSELAGEEADYGLDGDLDKQFGLI